MPESGPGSPRHHSFPERALLRPTIGGPPKRGWFCSVSFLANLMRCPHLHNPDRRSGNTHVGAAPRGRPSRQTHQVGLPSEQTNHHCLSTVRPRPVDRNHWAGTGTRPYTIHPPADRFGLACFRVQTIRSSFIPPERMDEGRWRLLEQSGGSVQRPSRSSCSAINRACRSGIQQLHRPRS